MNREIQQLQASGVGRAWVIALILICVAGRAMFLALPVNSDTAMFVYAGKLVAEGGRPGVDLLDNKLPSVGLLMSVPWRVFGANWVGYAALGLALSLFATLFLYRVARDLWDAKSASVVTIAAALWLNFPRLFMANCNWKQFKSRWRRSPARACCGQCEPATGATRSPPAWQAALRCGPNPPAGRCWWRPY